jgi:hypothetical protein
LWSNSPRCSVQKTSHWNAVHGPLIVTRASIHGFLVFDWWHRRDEALKYLSNWQHAGKNSLQGGCARRNRARARSISSTVARQKLRNAAGKDQVTAPESRFRFGQCLTQHDSRRRPLVEKDVNSQRVAYSWSRGRGVPFLRSIAALDSVLDLRRFAGGARSPWHFPVTRS